MLVARPPLQTFSTSELQMGSRRLSARLQEKDDALSKSYDSRSAGISSTRPVEEQGPGLRGGQKRKNNYDEEEDGFAFTRVNKNKKPRKTVDESKVGTTNVLETNTGQKASRRPMLQNVVEEPVPSSTVEADSGRATMKKRKKMSFSTPKNKHPEQQPVRRSKRISNETVRRDASPVVDSAPIRSRPKSRDGLQIQPSADTGNITETRSTEPEITNVTAQASKAPLEQNHSATKIALPYADTPIIRRNKAMREGRGSKGDRRSSLGLRGRRASSLIETGTSHALPHQEVDTNDFYKHIESDRIETSRMRQLLTWCATRAIHAKPVGTDFEDASAKSAARVIEEELLKELSNKSELSDWFSRQDVPEPPKSLPERPNPKNTQNLRKIAELEEQINRLKLERDALQHLLRPPVLVEVDDTSNSAPSTADIDQSLLSAQDKAILDALQASAQNPPEISQRINNISSKLGPSIDRFADSVHKVAQYRTTTDKVAGKVLAICADRIAERERDGRRKALQTEDDRSPGRDLSSVLRGLSRVER